MTLTASTVTFEDRAFVKWWEVPRGQRGYDARSEYVERFWLPVLGPSTTFLLRYLANQLEAHPLGCAIDLGEVARSLGLGDRTGQHAPFVRTLHRAIDFKVSTYTAEGHLAVLRSLPKLSDRHLSRLPESLRASHSHYVGNEQREFIDNKLTQRGFQLALSLLDLGETAIDAEQQLVRWRFLLATARTCVECAVAEQTKRAASSIELDYAVSSKLSIRT